MLILVFKLCKTVKIGQWGGIRNSLTGNWLVNYSDVVVLDLYLDCVLPFIQSCTCFQFVFMASLLYDNNGIAIGKLR